jgi:hypothetical protein
LLDRLTTKRALSPADLVAKARAVSTLDEDPDRQAAIAASLADDLLLHFGSL